MKKNFRNDAMPHSKSCAAGCKKWAMCTDSKSRAEAESWKIQFEDADETRFVISPQTPVRQIWISALTTSFKLAWSDAAGTFVLEKTGETLMQLMGRILTEQLGSPVSV